MPDFIQTITTFGKAFNIYFDGNWLLYVSEHDILGPNGNLSDIKNLVSFEREMIKDSSYK